MSAPLCLAGATATGKTALAHALAERLGARLLSADAMLVYRGMDIGTAKPTPEERARFAYRGLDCVGPDRDFSVGAWLAHAQAAQTEADAAGAPLVAVGGTGLYFQSLLHGIAEIPPVAADIIARLTARLEEEGSPALHAELTRRDPEYAARIHPNDRQRIVRALEVLEGTGKTFSWWHAHAMPAPLCAGPLACFMPELDALAPRLARRIDLMLHAGALEEARAALRRCDDPAAPGWSGIGCAELLAHLRGELSLEACKALWFKNTRAYAKRQLTWFRARPDAVACAPGDISALLALAGRR